MVGADDGVASLAQRGTLSAHLLGFATAALASRYRDEQPEMLPVLKLSVGTWFLETLLFWVGRSGV